jgi:hypothetical protein
VIWTHNRSLTGQQGVSNPVSLLEGMLADLFSHLRYTTTNTGLYGGLEHLKIETRLIEERFATVMGECVI